MRETEETIDPFTDEAIRRYQESETPEEEESQILQRMADGGMEITERLRRFVRLLREISKKEKEVVFDVILEPLKAEIRNETVIATLTVIRSSTNPHLSIDALKLITGMAAQEGKRASDYGRKHQIGRAAVSKEVRLLRESLHLRKSIDTRSDEICEMSRQRELQANLKVKRKLTLALMDESVKDERIRDIIEEYND